METTIQPHEQPGLDAGASDGAGSGAYVRRMAGNHQGSVTINVDSTSDIVTGKNFISSHLRTPCYIIFRYSQHEKRVEDILTRKTTRHHEWNKEVCFQIDPTLGDCVWVNMYKDNHRLIGECDIILSQVRGPDRMTYYLKKVDEVVRGRLILRVTFNRPAQEPPYPPQTPPPPRLYPHHWPRPQSPEQLMYPPGPGQSCQNGHQQADAPFYPPGPGQSCQNGGQQADAPFYPPGPPQDQWQNGPQAPRPMPDHPSPLYLSNGSHMNHSYGNHQAQHPGAMPDLRDIPIAEIYPPPISFTPRQDNQHTAAEQFVWSSADQQANQRPLTSPSTATDDEEDSDMEKLVEAFVHPV